MSAQGSVKLEGVVKRHGETAVLRGIDLEIRPGEFFVLLGPSGSGKTTTLRILAGLEPVSSGRVLMDGEDVTHNEPGARDVAMVFQSYALYPHMTVGQNIGFPLKMVGTPQQEVERQVAEAAARVNIAHLLARRPGQLSGGQQQRCALARAIVRKPRLFLLDEPLSNLDAKLRLETRIELHALQRSLGTTTVYVTHDQEEAMTLADRIAVFMEGQIAQIGSPREVFARPQTMAVAGFVGTPQMNILAGIWQDSNVVINGHALPVGRATTSARSVMLGVRPGDLTLAAGGLPARVERIEDLGDSAIVSLSIEGKQLKHKGQALPAARPGDSVFLNFAPSAAHLFDPQSGARL